MSLETAFQEIVGRVVASVRVDSTKTEKDTFTMTFAEGDSLICGVEGDCCSNSWIEHMEAPKDLAGAVVLAVEESAVVSNTVEDDSDDALIQVYQTHFRTTRGDVSLEYRNSSNGYYGGNLTLVQAPTSPCAEHEDCRENLGLAIACATRDTTSGPNAAASVASPTSATRTTSTATGK